MSDGLSLANLFGVLALLAWPADRCRDIVCPDQPVVERVPVSVERSLDLATASLEICRASHIAAPTDSCPATPCPEQQCSIYSFFWLGFICGAASVLLLLFVLRFLYNLFLGSARQHQGSTQLALPPAVPAAPVQVIEPANPNTLRQLGLQR